MSPSQLTNAVVSTLVAAINEGDKDAFLATLAPGATLTDDGEPRSLGDWIDREIFSVHGHMTVEREQDHGLSLLARYRNDTWGRWAVTSGTAARSLTAPPWQRIGAEAGSGHEMASGLLVPAGTRRPLGRSGF